MMWKISSSGRPADPEAQGNLFSPPVVADRLCELLVTGMERWSAA
jgi:hypothetical protein